MSLAANNGSLPFSRRQISGDFHVKAKVLLPVPHQDLDRCLFPLLPSSYFHSTLYTGHLLSRENFICAPSLRLVLLSFPLIFRDLRERQITPSYAYGCLFTDSVYPERLRNDDVFMQCELETLLVMYFPICKMVMVWHAQGNLIEGITMCWENTKRLK